MLKTRKLLAPLLALSLLTGCAQTGPASSSPPAQGAEPAKVAVRADVADDVDAQTADVPAALKRTTTSGFLSDYSKLQPNPIHKGSLIERSDKIAAYKSFMVDMPKVFPTTTVRGEPITLTTASQLAVALKAAASESLAANFTVTDRPGEGVARLRSAITQVAECYHEPGSPNRKVGGASVEMELVDSVTGERLAAAAESDAVTSRDPLLKSTDPFYDTKLVFQHWSSRLAKWLTDAQQ